MFTSSDPSADQLSVTFASHRLVLQYAGSFSALRPAEVRERDKPTYAAFILTALQRQHRPDTDQSGGLYGYEWRDDTRSSSAPRATLTIARTFDQYTVNIAILNLTPAAPTPSSSSSSSSASPSPSATYSRSLFPLLHSIRTGIVELQNRDKRVRERSKRQQEQLELIGVLLDDKSTEAMAVEEEWLGVCMRVLNAEKAKIRSMRAKTEAVKREIKALTDKAVPAAVKGRLSDSDSESEEEKKDERKGEEADGVTEMKVDDLTAAAMDDGPVLSIDSGAMELSLHSDSSFPPSSLTSVPSLQPDSNVNTQRSSSTSSSLTSLTSQSRMSGGLLESGESSRWSVRKRARVQPSSVAPSSAQSSVSGPSIPPSVSLSSSFNGSSRLLPPLSSALDKASLSTVRAPSPASVGTVADGRQTARQGVTALFDEL